MATQLAQQLVLDSPSIPDRLYFKIGDVARLCEVESHVLRFWETQFPQLKPNKSGTGQRLYRKSDVEVALRIKQLVHGDGYTIAGARQVLEQGKRRTVKQRNSQPRLPLAEISDPRLSRAASALDSIRSELREIAAQLASPQSMPAPTRRRSSRLTQMRSSCGLLFPAEISVSEAG